MKPVSCSICFPVSQKVHYVNCGACRSQPLSICGCLTVVLLVFDQFLLSKILENDQILTFTFLSENGYSGGCLPKFLHVSPFSLFWSKNDNFRTIDSRQEEFIKRLTEAVAIPSVSGDPARFDDCDRMSKWTQAIWNRLGAETELFYPKGSCAFPSVFL